MAVTLYPSGALVTEEESVKPQDGRVTLDLPAGADESSLVFSLSQGEVLSRTVRLMPGEASPAVAALRREADALRDEMDMSRAISPLRKAHDAIELDNSHMSIDEQNAWLMARYNEVTERIKQQ